MINITLSDLDRNTIYPQTLQAIEDFCEEFHLQNDFGTISTANQEIIDYLSNYFVDYNIEFSLSMEGQNLDLEIFSTESVFQELRAYDNADKILEKLSDKITISSDNKQLILSFHVKPMLQIQRNLQSKVTKKVFLLG